MPKLVHTQLTSRRLVTLAAIGALLATFMFIQGHAIRGVAAGPKALPPVLARCDSANIAPTVPEPFASGADVVFTASSTSCVAPQYRYLLLAPGGSTWAFETDYTTSPSFTWKTAGAKPGVWQVGVWARESGSVARYNAYAITSFTVGATYCSAAHFGLQAPQTAGITVYVGAAAAGCPEPYFEFWELAPGSSTWVVVQPYTLGNPASVGTPQPYLQYAFNTTGVTPGAYRFGVWARQTGSSRRYDTYAFMTLYVLAP
jgi:hypothetical protein